jgi:hypothetical protein
MPFSILVWWLVLSLLFLGAVLYAIGFGNYR